MKETNFPVGKLPTGSREQGEGFLKKIFYQNISLVIRTRI
jgi:hypothetical protein